MSERQQELYRQIRYWLETSLAPADADEAVIILDALVQQTKQDVVHALVARMTDGLVD